MNSQLKSTIGKILIAMQPKKASELLNKGMTIDMDLSRKDRLMRYALLEKAKTNKDFETLSQFHQKYWENRGEEYFSSGYNNNVLENFFIPKCSFLFDLLQEQFLKESETYHTLIEIGTGDGKVLEYLSEKLPQIKRFIGIDLSISQIDANKKVFDKNANLEFVASDGFDWIKKNGQDHMIIVTSRGVLEYFTQSRLQEFFDLLNKMGKIIFIAIEPTGLDHDFIKNPNSEIYGDENSFSHNYAQLFKNSGFDIWHQSKILYSQPECYINFIGAKN
jgi:hypothetical protein